MIVAVKEPAFLFAVHGIVGGIKIQHQLLGRTFERNRPF
jgi:hypothetical protein